MTHSTATLPRPGARRARTRLFVATVALGALCLIASGLTGRVEADESYLPMDVSQFAGAWEGEDFAAPTWLDSRQSQARTQPLPRVMVEMVQGEPKIVLVRYKLQVDIDGSFRFVAVPQSTTKAEIRGGALLFRIQSDAMVASGAPSGSVDTEWKLEVADDRRLTLSAVAGFGLSQAVRMRRAPLGTTFSAEGC